MYLLPLYCFSEQEAWFSKGSGGYHSSGYIEERLKNVKKRMPKQSWGDGVKKPLKEKEPSMKEKIQKANSVGM